MGIIDDFLKLDRIPMWKRLRAVPSEVGDLKARVTALEETLAGKFPFVRQTCSTVGTQPQRRSILLSGSPQIFFDSIDPKQTFRVMPASFRLGFLDLPAFILRGGGGSTSRPAPAPHFAPPAECAKKTPSPPLKARCPTRQASPSA
jgi:hypothetical protein